MTAPIHSLVVGGTRGIGRSVAKALMADGHDVSVVARRAPDDDRRLAGVGYFQADLTDAPQLKTSLEQVTGTKGPVSNVVFLQRFRGEGDSWQAEIDASLTGTKNAVEMLDAHFAEGDKSIVVVSSINATLIAAYLPIGYHVAKAALQQMVRYWAVLLGPRGIRVNSVSPGTVLKEESKDFFLSDTALAELYVGMTPLRRMGRAEEVAQVVSFLCGPKASFVTGQDIVVDGGVSLQWQEHLVRETAGLSAAAPRPVR